MVNMWGIYTTSKEANMYPKPIQDLSGWNVRSIACSTKVALKSCMCGFEHANCSCTTLNRFNANIENAAGNVVSI